MDLKIDKPVHGAAKAAEIAGLQSTQHLSIMRVRDGLRLGKLRHGSRDVFLYSALDIAELASVRALVAMGLGLRDAISMAHDDLRPALRDLFINRLALGFWSLGRVDVPTEVEGAVMHLYLDAIGDRVITKLNLPSPYRPFPRDAEVAARMVDAIFDYILSPPGRARWSRWHDAVIARGGEVSVDDAAAELGAPVWFLSALIAAVRQSETEVDQKIVDAVSRRAAGASDHLNNVVLH